MSFMANSLTDLVQHDKVQLGIDLRKYQPILGVGTWVSFANDSVCIGNAVFHDLTSGGEADANYLWITGEVAYLGPSTVHIIPAGFVPKRQGKDGQVIHAHEVCEVDYDSPAIAAVLVDDRPGRVGLVNVDPKALQAAGQDDPGLFDLPGTTYLTADGTFPLMVLDEKGIVRMVVDADGEPRTTSVDDFPMDWLHTDWGDNWQRVPNMTDEMRQKALALLDFTLALEKLTND